jgi:hypothetical protein
MKTRTIQVSLAMTLAWVSPGTVASQQAPQSAAASPNIPPGPSMKETEAWIKRELPKIGRDSVVTSVVTKNGALRQETTYEIRNATLTDCTLKFQSISHWVITPNTQSVTATVPMKNLDLSRLVAMEAPPSAGYTASKPSYIVRLVAQSDLDASRPFNTEFNNNDGKPPKLESIASFHIRVRDMASANQAAETLRRAAVLCGVTDRPVDLAAIGSCETMRERVSCRPPRVAAAPAQDVTTKPAAGATSTMTNSDVIQMVAAGLSEQVISTSIRQAAAKAFDLSPAGLIALKNGKVSDAVMLAMQGDTSAPVAAVAPAATPPKYDAALAEPTKPAAAPVSQNGCSGIENMGVYKNEIFDRAMGGGVVEWLAKIRNNTPVTKIVVLGWRDMYGQQKSSQVQIQGGGIASPRLDLTQARVIPPVADVRLLSCQ